MPVAKYVRIPVELVALQYTGTNREEVNTLTGGLVKANPFDRYSLLLDKPAGSKLVEVGDYVVRTQEGLIGSVSAALFENMFQLKNTD